MSGTEDPDDAEGDDAEFSAADLGSPRYELPPRRADRAFQPWHRPRKHFVRRNQWLACIRDIFDARPPDDRITYLGLPGIDLLDLRYLHQEVCQPDQRTLQFLGFDHSVPGSPDGIDLAVSLHEVKLSEFIHESSQILPDDIRMIGSERSMAYQTVSRAGPFDVINLDLCTSVIEDHPTATSSLYTALNRLVALQARNPNPWLLLITSVVDRSGHNAAAATLLQARFTDALERCEGLAELCAGLFDADDVFNLDLDVCSPEDFLNVVAIGLCAWLFERAQAHAPMRLNLRAVFGYRLVPTAECNDMISLALRFTPVIAPAADPIGLAQAPPAELPELCETMSQVVGKADARFDVDLHLVEHPEVRDELVTEMADLLEQARYRRELYVEWVADFAS